MEKTVGLTEYEKVRSARIAEIKVRLQELGVQNIGKSLTSLVESSKSNKRKDKGNTPSNKGRDVEYVPTFDGESEEGDDPSDGEILRKVTRLGSRQQVRCIPPRLMRKFSTISKRGLGINNDDGADKTRLMAQTKLLINERRAQERQNAEVSLRQTNKGSKMTMDDLIIQKKLQLEKEVDTNNNLQQLSCLLTDKQNRSTTLERQALGDQYHPQDVHNEELIFDKDDFLSDSEGESSFGYGDKRLNNFVVQEAELENE
ncbi:hypothetical protein RND81_02G169700 [Saponaria officinalis]|uniref:Uncharacterized protein n=1 Tax=Saponaria officinalis TaxID=3572 RepID=A0AAW1MM57_SAPOF